MNDDATQGVIISLNCETDFVAKNDDYVALAHKMADIAINHDSKEDFLAAKFNDKMSVEEKSLNKPVL